MLLFVWLNRFVPLNTCDFSIRSGIYLFYRPSMTVWLNVNPSIKNLIVVKEKAFNECLIAESCFSWSPFRNDSHHAVASRQLYSNRLSTKILNQTVSLFDFCSYGLVMTLLSMMKMAQKNSSDLNLNFSMKRIIFSNFKFFYLFINKNENSCILYNNKINLMKISYFLRNVNLFHRL